MNAAIAPPPGGGLAMLVKTPGISPVKTRLAAVHGQAYAEGWHLRAAAAVAAVAQRAAVLAGAQAYWAVAEPPAHQAWTGLPVLAQGEGGLGARMGRVHGQLVARHGAGLLLGADAPQLTPDLLLQALAWLRQPGPRLVLGPAADGGFWLFGGNRALPTSAWTRPRYSVADTALQFRAALAGQGAWCELPTLVDVDRADDLPAVQAALSALETPLPQQSALAGWMAAQAGVAA